jgi:hypothetical protein
MNPLAQQALVSGALGAVGAGLSAAGKSKDDAANRRFSAQQQFLGQGPGAEPAAYARLAMQRALWEGLPEDATSTGISQMQVPEEMRGFVPDAGPGLALGGARQQMMSRLSDDVLAQDQLRRRTVEDQALGMAVGGQKEKKKSGFWGKLGKGLLKIAPIAASFIPGVGPALGMAIAAGSGAASGAMGGGGVKGALLGGAMGAAGSRLPGALGKVAGGAPKPPMSRPQSQPVYY